MGAQTLPQPPQFFTSASVGVSHPSAALPLQSAWPALHVTTHAAFVQATALVNAEPQTLPHVPQLLVAVRLASQPSLPSLSQSANPELHTRVHTPLLHVVASAFVPTHPLPQPPQFFGSDAAVFVSHPFAGSSSQSSKPGLHVVMTHLPALHAPGPLSFAHTFPQPPQFEASVSRFVSHPSLLASQSANPVIHAAAPPPPPLEALLLIATLADACVDAAAPPPPDSVKSPRPRTALHPPARALRAVAAMQAENACRARKRIGDDLIGLDPQSSPGCGRDCKGSAPRTEYRTSIHAPLELHITRAEFGR